MGHSMSNQHKKMSTGLPQEEKDGKLYNSVYTCIVLNIVIDLTVLVHGI